MKPFNFRNVHVAALVLFALMTLPVAARAQFLHPRILKKETTIRTIVILPAKVNVVRDSMKGPEGMAAESEELSARVEKMLAEVLANKKKVDTLALTASAGEEDSQAKYAVADLQTKFDDLLPRVMRKRSDVKKGRFTLGDEVLNLNLDKTADAIVFIRGQGQKLTSGKKAFAFIVPTMPAHLMLRIGVVDARTGEVLIYTDPIFTGDPTTAVDRLRKALEKGFKKLPAVN